MIIATIATAIHEEISNLLWTIRDVEVAARIEVLAKEANAIDLFSYNCLHFGRQYNSVFFLLSASLWHGFVLDDWAKLVKNIRPRPEPIWAWDGGQFCDIAFLLSRLQIDAFEIAQNVALLEAEELSKVIRFGEIHLDVLLREDAVVASEEDEQPDPYESILARSVAKVRSQLLIQAPRLDIAGKPLIGLREQITRRLIEKNDK